MIAWEPEWLIAAMGALAMAAGALAVAAQRRPAMGRWLLAFGALMGLAGMVGSTLYWGEDAYHSTVTALAGMLTFATFWSVALAPPAPGAQARYGLLAAGAVAGYLLVPRRLAVSAVLNDVSYGLSGWAYVAGAGALVAGLAHTARGGAGAESEAPVNPFLSLATLCLTVSWAAQGAAAQWAWGSYWAGDPAEYLRLVGWAAVALAWVVATEFDRHRWAAAWSLRVATGVVIIVLLGSMALLEALGVPSLYLAV